MSRLNLQAASSIWLVAEERTLRQRLLADVEFLRFAGDSDDRAELIERFVDRSVQYNRMIIDQAEPLGFPLVTMSDDSSVEEACETCLKRITAIQANQAG